MAIITDYLKRLHDKGRRKKFTLRCYCLCRPVSVPQVGTVPVNSTFMNRIDYR
ncbi:hypothetical protein ACH5A7_39930 [Streptomyces sp. NPDC018955]|uniref:hypothetical protein n=1 Tax=unclassified Streptomyces TaxID=2593676 RepID=UPI0033FB7A7E